MAYELQDGMQKVLATSKNVVATTTGGRYTNYKSVKVSKSSVKVKRGKKSRITATAVAPRGGRVKQYRKVKFESSDKDIATVNKNGVIQGKKKGTCYVYAYAQNGAYKKIKVTVR